VKKIIVGRRIRCLEKRNWKALLSTLLENKNRLKVLLLEEKEEEKIRKKCNTIIGRKNKEEVGGGGGGGRGRRNNFVVGVGRDAKLKASWE
jgi:hypothetical protein